MRLSDLVTGSAFALLGLFAVVYAQGLPSPGGALGAGLFPTIIGGVMALSGIALVVKSIVASSAFPFIHVDPWMKDPRKITALVAIPVAIAAFGLFSASIGTIAVAAIILAIAALIWGERPVTALIVAVVVSAGIYAFFYFALRVPLPGAFIEGLLR